MTLGVSTPKLRFVGDNYVVIPFEPSGEVAKWLRKEHVRFPSSMKKSRWPTMAELVSILEAIPGATVERRKNGQSGWDLQISRDAADGLERADLWLKDVTDLDTPAQFDFHKPSPDLAITIVERLTHITGSLVFMTVTEMVPVLVRPGADLAEISARLFSRPRPAPQRSGARRKA